MKIFAQSDLTETKKSETLFVNENSIKQEKAGHKVYKFGFGQSPFLPPAYIIDELKKTAHRKEYMPVQGLLELRESAAKFHHDHDHFNITEKNVIVGPGSKMLIYCCLATLKRADVFLITPSWVSYEPQAQLAGHPITRLATSFSNRWRLTPDQLETACKERKDTSKPVVMIINYPGNPDGLTYSPEELEALTDVARKYNVLIISDEIYGLLHHEAHHVSIAHYYPEGTIVTTGLSKWCGAGGWRLGLAFLPESWESTFRESLLGIASETYSCVSSPVQLAGIKAYERTEDLDSYLDHQRRILSLIGNYVQQALTKAEVNVHPPDGGFYLNPDFSPLREQLEKRGIFNSDQLCEKLLEETGVTLLPGSAFGYPSSRLVTRLAYVDFDGCAALEASEKIGLSTPLTSQFMDNYAPKIKAGTQEIVKWLSNE